MAPVENLGIQPLRRTSTPVRRGLMRNDAISTWFMRLRKPPGEHIVPSIQSHNTTHSSNGMERRGRSSEDTTSDGSGHGPTMRMTTATGLRNRVLLSGLRPLLQPPRADASQP